MRKSRKPVKGGENRENNVGANLSMPCMVIMHGVRQFHPLKKGEIGRRRGNRGSRGVAAAITHFHTE